MKKQIALIPLALVLVLASCSSNASSGVSSDSSNSNTSSSSMSSSSSSVEPIESSGLAEYIAAKSSYYNQGRTAKELLSDSGLTHDAAFTKGNVARLLKAAFEGYMPAMMGQRKLLVYESELEGKKNIPTQEVLDAVNWICQFGLWVDFDDETKVMTKKDIDTIFARFYQYFGTNYKDDFDTSINYDFYFANENTDVSYYKSKLVDSEKIQSTCLDYMKRYIGSGSEYTSRYKGALDYFEGEINYSFLKEEGIADEISNLSNPVSESAWVSSCYQMFKDYGSSPLLNFVSVEGYYKAGEKSLTPTSLFTLGNLNLTAYSYDDTEFVTTQKQGLISSMKSIGLTDEDSSAKADLVLEFGRKQKELYTTTYKGYKIDNGLVYDTKTSTDVLEKEGISFNFRDIFTGSGLEETWLPSVITPDPALFMSTAKALDESSLAAKAALGAYSYIITNFNAISYKPGEPLNFDTAKKLFSRALASDFLKTDVWASNRTLTLKIIDDLVSAFIERTAVSPWLSKDGAAAVKEKLDNLSNNLYSANNDGICFDYASYVGEWDGAKLSKELGSYQVNSCKMTLKMIAANKNIAEVYNMSMDPFVANAFYIPAMNCMNITLGYLFSYGADFNSLSDEELYSSLGFVCGHEITHGFDSQGSFYDKDGLITYTSIFGESDRKIFEDKQKQVIENYDGKEAFPLADLAKPGTRVITEAMADIGGLSLAEALGSKINGFDYSSFYKYVANHMATASGVFMYILSFNDVHPNGKVRTNTLLSNSSRFIETFDIKEGDGMFMPASQRVVIW